ncbi:MAG: hypothetical protein KDA32_10300 [Phycisphaerales bacterium]|nr:hypothetical protein [Phycisphaerales bacterium]
MNQPWDPDHFQQVCQAREELIRESCDPRQVALYHLDRMTHPGLVMLVDEMPVCARKKRADLVRAMSIELAWRVDQREQRLEPHEQELVGLAAIDTEFRETERLLEGRCSLTDLLLDFAAGHLSKEFEFVHEGRRLPYRLSDPDGGFIFLFAEFALAANRVLDEYWTLGVVHELVKMQSYFLERSKRFLPSTWRSLKQTPHTLSAPTRQLIDDGFKRRRVQPLTRESLASIIGENLKYARGESATPYWAYENDRRR